ncbi:acetyltransferase [Pseudomonas luteola]|uniref:Acetyltransferase n=1 Tax=Pseudomonas luteola TaxID=47886 RepID=A0ABS0MU71_PSELU|nr:acetyltransferase [Pseudomonas luteola]MBH3440267.1 acetyltransferase [Pseudomonas luteola]
MSIRRATPADIPLLAEIWEQAVRATHYFLPEDDIDFFRPLVRDSYLPSLETWVSLSDDDQPAGFIGLTQASVDMLFVDPARRGQGHGKRLLHHAVGLYGRLAVDVNEQNDGAKGFYLAHGFTVTGRSAVDSLGKPYPILHLKQEA